MCGFDGVTYDNQCQSYDSGTGVDYRGPCLPDQDSRLVSVEARCSWAQCPAIDSSVCELFVPPGACCPRCGSILRLVYSKKDVETHKSYINPVPIAVKDVVKSLRQQLKVVNNFLLI